GVAVEVGSHHGQRPCGADIVTNWSEEPGDNAVFQRFDARSRSRWTPADRPPGFRSRSQGLDEGSNRHGYLSRGLREYGGTSRPARGPSAGAVPGRWGTN